MTSAAQLYRALEHDRIRDPNRITGAMFHEIGSPIPGSARRADALWVPFGVRSGEIEGFEIKVSRADLMRELADPTKAEWAAFCTRWWLLVPIELAEDAADADLPVGWGVMTPPVRKGGRAMHIVKPAATVKPTGDPAVAWAKLLRHRLWAQHNRDVQQDYDRKAFERRQRSLEEAEKRLQDQLGRQRTPAHEAALDSLSAALEQRLGTFWWNRPRAGVSFDDVAEAVADLQTAKRATETLRQRGSAEVDNLHWMAERIAGILAAAEKRTASRAHQ